MLKQRTYYREIEGKPMARHAIWLPIAACLLVPLILTAATSTALTTVKPKPTQSSVVAIATDWGQGAVAGVLPVAAAPRTQAIGSLGSPVHVLHVSIEGFNKTSLGFVEHSPGFVEQSKFEGTAAIYVKPINSSFTEVIIRFSGTISPGIEPFSMSEGWETACYGSDLFNCSPTIIKVRLNTTNFMQFSERRVNFTLRYVVMNKYNYAWDEDTGQFIGFLPFYVVPDFKWHADWNKLPKKFLYFSTLIRIKGRVINVLTGEWKPSPAVLILEHQPKPLRELPTIEITTNNDNSNYSPNVSIEVVRHYVVNLDCFYELPFKELAGVYIGNYSYVRISGSGINNEKFLKYLKSIDDVPADVNIIDWEVVRAWAMLIVIVASNVACAAYLVRRRRGR